MPNNPNWPFGLTCGILFFQILLWLMCRSPVQALKLFKNFEVWKLNFRENMELFNHRKQTRTGSRNLTDKCLYGWMSQGVNVPFVNVWVWVSYGQVPVNKGVASTASLYKFFFIAGLAGVRRPHPGSFVSICWL